jgi:glycine oxidase
MSTPGTAGRDHGSTDAAEPDSGKAAERNGKTTVAVVGGGIVGLSVAWRLVRHGIDVSVHDPGRDDGAWWVAAGMLAPGGESAFEHAALAELMRESAKRWPGFAAELAGETGHDLGYDEAGTLSVALTADDVAEARRMWAYQGLRPTALRDLEPELSPRVRAGAHAPDDRQVDPRRVVTALRAALAARIVTGWVAGLDDLPADTVVVAAGCGTAALTGLPVRPVKGQLLRLRGEPGVLRHVISGAADGRHVYLVPRADGEVVVGATQEERTDRAVTAGGVLDLLRAAIDLVPALAEFELVETLVGHRPATPDNAPLLGPVPGDSGRRVLVAAGHHRNGVLLAPVTADLIAELVVTGVPDPLLEAFRPGRFSCT